MTPLFTQAGVNDIICTENYFIWNRKECKTETFPLLLSDPAVGLFKSFGGILLSLGNCNMNRYECTGPVYSSVNVSLTHIPSPIKVFPSAAMFAPFLSVLLLIYWKIRFLSLKHTQTQTHTHIPQCRGVRWCSPPAGGRWGCCGWFWSVCESCAGPAATSCSRGRSERWGCGSDQDKQCLRARVRDEGDQTIRTQQKRSCSILIMHF